MKIENIITLFGFVLIILSMILFGGYYLFTQTQLCVSDPLRYTFQNETDMILNIINNSESLRICSFSNNMTMSADSCIVLKG